MGALNIIGSGLLAKSFLPLQVDRDILLFASGVSNSGELSSDAFDREERLLTDSLELNEASHFVYFSTCSIEAPIDTPYTRHKLRMERLISQRSFSYSVFRLPQVVGHVHNTTLVSYFADAILRHKRVALQKFARRYLIGIDDVVRVVEIILNSGVAENKILNISSQYDVAVMDVFMEMCILLNSFPEFDLLDSGTTQYVDVQPLRAILPSDELLFSEDYWRVVLRKYVPKYLKQTG